MTLRHTLNDASNGRDCATDSSSNGGWCGAFRMLALRRAGRIRVTAGWILSSAVHTALIMRAASGCGGVAGRSNRVARMMPGLSRR